MLDQKQPRVTVLSAVYNGERFLDEAIASIVAQSYADFEYILINDASTDSSPDILAQWAARDSRIRILHNERNINPSGALNRGLSEARGEYIANIDQDDISYPTRLAEQVAFLDANPTVGVVGSQARAIDEQGAGDRIINYPTNPALAKWVLFFQTPVIHSAAMMRRAIVEQVGKYSLRAWMAGDYELFLRIAKVAEISNLPTTLVAYRRSSTQVTSTSLRPQTGRVLLFLQAMLQERFGFDIRSLPAITALFSGVRGHSLEDEISLVAAGELMNKLYTIFVATTDLSTEDAQVVAQDCARRYLLMAWGNRRQFRTASRTLLTRALEVDPDLWQHPQTRQMLRRCYRKELAQASLQLDELHPTS